MIFIGWIMVMVAFALTLAIAFGKSPEEAQKRAADQQMRARMIGDRIPPV